MRRTLRSSLKRVLPVILAGMVSGCTTVSNVPYSVSHSATDINGDPLAFNINAQVPLGQVEGSGADPSKAGISQYGLTTSVKQKWSLDEAKTSGANVVYPSTISELFWFAQFSIAGSARNNFSRGMHIQWIQPDGKIYRKEDFKVGFWNETFAKTSLKLSQPLPTDLIGRWRVRVWKGEQLVDDRFFEIVRV